MAEESGTKKKKADFQFVDNRQLTEDDYQLVHKEVKMMSARYYRLGIALGLPPSELEIIKEQNPKNIQQAFDEMLLTWLRWKHDYEKYGPPTWRTLVEAVDEDNHALAVDIAKKHPLNDTDSEVHVRVDDDVILESSVNPRLSRRHVGESANEDDNNVIAQPNYRHQFRQLKARSIHCNRKCLFLIHLLLIITTIMTIVVVEQKNALFDKMEGHSYLLRDFYTPGDSRLLPLSAWFSVFHSSIVFELKGDKFTSSASIFVVDSLLKIPLKYNNTAPVVKRSIVAEDTYRFWKFYLHSNSVINGTVCTSEQPLETFIVKGKHNMDRWHRTYHHKYVVGQLHQSVMNCQGVTNISYTIVEEDYYFVVVFNRDNAKEPLVNVKLNFKRFQYSYTRSSSNCMLTPYKECSITVPFPYSFTQEFSLLILTSIPREVDWDEEMFIKMSYSYRIIPCFLVCVACYVLTGLICNWCYKYCKK